MNQETQDRIRRACLKYGKSLPPTVETEELFNHAVMIWLELESRDKTEINPSFVASQAYRQVTGDGTVGRSTDSLFTNTGPRDNVESNTDPIPVSVGQANSQEITDALIDLGQEKRDFLELYQAYSATSVVLGESCILAGKMEQIQYSLGYGEEAGLCEVYEAIKAELKQILEAE